MVWLENGVMKALHGNGGWVFHPDRNDHHCSKRSERDTLQPIAVVRFPLLTFGFHSPRRFSWTVALTRQLLDRIRATSGLTGAHAPMRSFGL